MLGVGPKTTNIQKFKRKAKREKFYLDITLKFATFDVGPWIIGGMSSVVIFLRNPNPYLCEFRRKPHRNFFEKRQHPSLLDLRYDISVARVEIQFLTLKRFVIFFQKYFFL